MSTLTTPGTPPGGPPAAAPAPPARRRRRPTAGGWVLVALGALLALGTVAATGAGVAGALSQRTDDGARSFAGVETVEVRNDCGGDVTASGAPGAGDRVELSWRDRYGLVPPEHTQRLVDGALVVAVSCPGWGGGWQSTSDLVLTLPATATLDVAAGSGDVRATGLGAPAALRTGSGDVEVTAATADLEARTGSGDVVVTDATGSRIEAQAGSGDVTIAAARAPREVVGRTGSGDLFVELPDDGEGYDVTTDAGAGEVTVDVLDAPSARRSVELRSGSGDITVLPAG